MQHKAPKSVAIITIHFGTNHGSVLQAYALSNYLDSIGYNAEIIDYVPERYKVWNSLVKKRSNKYPLPVIIAYYPIAFCKSFRVRNKFECFVKKNLNLTKRYSSKQALQKEPPEADVYITGSDQVWNNDYNGNDEFSYYLDFTTDDAKRIAYAASFGKEDIADSNYLSVVKSHLQTFDAISVRESNAQYILNKIGINSVHVVDPVFLRTQQQWKEFGTKYPKKEKYTLVYVMDGIYNELLEYAYKIKKETGNSIYVVSFTKIKDNRIDKSFHLADPKDFVGLIDNSDIVVTNSFHGTAFSVLFQKRFITIGKEKYNSRILSLLTKLKLENHFVPTGDNCDIQKIMTIIERQHISHEEEILQNWISTSKSFIQSEINKDSLIKEIKE
jgi:polysaccharide pyruvyl transferase WcaK-like protein